MSTGEAQAQVREGAHYEITGVWSAETLRATEIKPPEDSVRPREAEIEGRITAIDIEKKSLQIGPVTVQWSESTRFERIKPEELKIATPIEAAGRIIEPRRLLATVIERGSASLESDYINILGPVTDVEEKADGSAALKVIGVSASLSADVYGKIRTPSFEADEEDEQIQPGLWIGGEYEAILDYRRRFALDKRAKDDLL
ncbi:MAG: DUF5666 domain-containing protein, partial [Acidiferrobacterales bacterium]|nr:DUF5666 domain-containing protein [Acidiferrobacterales bacterium]